MIAKPMYKKGWEHTSHELMSCVTTGWAYPHSVAIPYLYSTLRMKSCTPSLMILNAPSFKFVWCSTSGILVV
ncbi:Uncharacterised protein [Vibrio cholerae]|nr:Uncharacterised protein [Vibrio cholerae]